MARDRAIQNEVRQAVHEYVNQLIDERRAPGRGMAVSAHDLMVATKSAGYKPNMNDTRHMLDAFAETGMQIIKETPRAPIQPKYNPMKKKPTNDGKKLRRKDYHWMAWPSPSPTPDTEHSATPRPQTARSTCKSQREFASKMIPRPASAAAVVPVESNERPTVSPTKSAVARAQTPRAPTPRMPTPAPAVPIRPQTPSLPPTPLPTENTGNGIENLYLTPQPTIAHQQHGFNERPVSALSYRSATPQIRGGTPAEFNPDYRDPMEAQVTNAAALNTNAYNNPDFVPGLQAWVTNANDYEREVAYNLMQAIKVGGGRCHSPYKGTKRTQVRYPTAGVQTSYSFFDQYKNQGWNIEDMMVAGRSIAQPPGADYYRYSKKGARPGVARHQNTFIPPKEYTCETSFFQPSNRPFKRDFIINPEWASESNMGKRNLSMMMTTKGPKGFRYCSK